MLHVSCRSLSLSLSPPESQGINREVKLRCSSQHIQILSTRYMYVVPIITQGCELDHQTRPLECVSAFQHPPKTPPTALIGRTRSRGPCERAARNGTARKIHSSVVASCKRGVFLLPSECPIGMYLACTEQGRRKNVRGCGLHDRTNAGLGWENLSQRTTVWVAYVCMCGHFIFYLLDRARETMPRRRKGNIVCEFR